MIAKKEVSKLLTKSKYFFNLLNKTINVLRTPNSYKIGISNPLCRLLVALPKPPKNNSRPLIVLY